MSIKTEFTKMLRNQAEWVMPLQPHVGLILEILAHSIEMGTTAQLAEAVIAHESSMLLAFKQDCDDTLLASQSTRHTPSSN